MIFTLFTDWKSLQISNSIFEFIHTNAKVLQSHVRVKKTHKHTHKQKKNTFIICTINIQIQKQNTLKHLTTSMYRH